ncbi:MAG: antibiotic biosynthesis monooxygenase [Hyphomicrobiaceae bacterium]|nr:antibiotic biosynthesis monooxygenase [Hyphomicrobiaceae bacterium]
MRALFFEVTPKPGHMDSYFQVAAALKPDVEASGGLLFLDRYMSLLRPGTVLSYQFWQDETALARWRANATHHRAQRAGRDVHFADYRLRIAEVMQSFDRDTGKDAGIRDFPVAGSVPDELRFVASVESVGEPFPRGEQFKSVNREDTFVSVLHVANEAKGREIVHDASTQDFVTGAHLCLIDRDYGMRDRAEAPQTFETEGASAKA